MLVLILTAAVIGLLLILFMWQQANRNVVTEKTFYFDTFPESFQELKLFFISDIHRRKISPQLLSESLHADMVIIGGDLMEKGVSFETVKQNLEQLKKIGPVFFVWGNNDYEVDYHKLDSLLLDQHIKILDNTSVTFESEKGERFVLVGVDSLTNKRDRIDLALEDRHEADFSILISHDPAIIKKIRNDHFISLVLSGHTHGGQIRLGPFGLYSKGGTSKVGQTTLFISNGYGTTLIPLRFGAPAEANLITVKKG